MRDTARLVALCAVLTSACDQDWPGDVWDVAVDTLSDTAFDPGYDTIPSDTTPDLYTDTGLDPGVDTAPDTGVDTGTDPGVDTGGPCTDYPPGPYAFSRLGDTVGPATWPAMIKAPTETSSLAVADLQEFYCDPDVESVIVFIATIS
jgi:hypothetical protein